MWRRLWLPSFRDQQSFDANVCLCAGRRKRCCIPTARHGLRIATSGRRASSHRSSAQAKPRSMLISNLLPRKPRQSFCSTARRRWPLRKSLMIYRTLDAAMIDSIISQCARTCAAGRLGHGCGKRGRVRRRIVCGACLSQPYRPGWRSRRRLLPP